MAAARSFLERYVDPDGRVVRHDQGGDTVSEGQGYALLLSVAAGDERRFDAVWGWTRAHLQRPDGLLSYHWEDGHVADPTPAADADTQIAWALLLGGRRFGRGDLVEQARRVALAVVSREAGYDVQGHVTLAAGPWAVGRGHPVTVEPGYWTFPAYQALAALTGDQRWKDLTASDLRHLVALTHDGRVLPPDWAQLGQGSPRPVAAPGGGRPVEHGPDGMRVTVWSSCTADGRRLLGRTWPLLRHDAAKAPTARALDARRTDDHPAALSAVAAAAAASAAHQDAESTRLLRLADRVAAAFPTYYGDAWAALGRVLLTTDLLARCG